MTRQQLTEQSAEDHIDSCKICKETIDLRTKAATDIFNIADITILRLSQNKEIREHCDLLQNAFLLFGTAMLEVFKNFSSSDDMKNSIVNHFIDFFIKLTIQHNNLVTKESYEKQVKH